MHTCATNRSRRLARLGVVVWLLLVLLQVLLIRAAASDGVGSATAAPDEPMPTFSVSQSVSAPAFKYRNAPVPLVEPDETNTKLRVSPDGLDFLRSLSDANLVLIAVAGRAKTGKSYLLNHLIGLPQQTQHEQCTQRSCGFRVGTSFAPGTKGILLWGNPFAVRVGDRDYTVVYMDTEGLGAPGNPVDSYDPKVCALTVILSSLVVFNVKQNFDMHDVNLLHSVVALSRMFEEKLDEKFPFPHIMWTMQQFEQDLLNLTPEEYLEEVLKEKRNEANTDEIRRYNETVRVVKQFPDIGEPRIVLFDRPARTVKQLELPSVDLKDLDKSYVGQVAKLKRVLQRHLFVKTFGNVAANGRLLANLVAKLVDEMNELSDADVVPTLLNQMSIEIKERCFEHYGRVLSETAALPQDEHALAEAHEEARQSALDLFDRNCTGGPDAFGNRRIRNDLAQMLDERYRALVLSNRDTAVKVLRALAESTFQPLRNVDSFSSVQQFEQRTDRLRMEYLVRARGPTDIKNSILEHYMSSLEHTRELVLKNTAKTDFKDMVVALIVLVCACFVGGLLASPFSPAASQTLRGFSTLFVMALVCVIVVYNDLAGDSFKEYVTFGGLQYWFNLLRWLVQLVRDGTEWTLAGCVLVWHRLKFICGAAVVLGLSYRVWSLMGPLLSTARRAFAPRPSKNSNNVVSQRQRRMRAPSQEEMERSQGQFLQAFDSHHGAQLAGSTPHKPRRQTAEHRAAIFHRNSISAIPMKRPG